MTFLETETFYDTTIYKNIYVTYRPALAKHKLKMLTINK